MKTLLKLLLVAVCCASPVVAEAQAPAAPQAPATAQAPAVAKPVSETIEHVKKTFPKETEAEGAELPKKIEQFVTKYGDDGTEAVRKVGPKGMRIADEAGENGATVVKAMAQFGDAAAEVLVKHKGIAESLVNNGGEPAVRALKAIDGPSARLMSRMSTDPASSALTHNAKLLDVISQYGDDAVRYIWRNKGKLSAASVLATFVANPKPFIDGLSDLSQAAVAPPGEGAEGVRSSWSFMIWIVVLAAAAVAGWQLYVRYKIHLAHQQQQTGPIARK